MNSINVARIVVAVGGVLTAMAFIKATVIGYYPSETMGMIVLGAVGLGILWIGGRLHSSAKKAGAAAAAHERGLD